VFAEELEKLVQLLHVAATSRTPLDLHDLMYHFTLDSFGQIGFGVNPGCLDSEAQVPFAAAFDKAQVVSMGAALVDILFSVGPCILKQLICLVSLV
jgi:fatty acid omega-hydroxylase